MLTESYHSVRRYHLIGIVVLSMVASPLHFIYEWLGENIVIGMFAPISESVWEHMKLSFWPTLVWWAVGYFLYRKKLNLDARRWFFASFFALLLTPLMVIGTFYTMEAGFGIESLIVDIITLFIAIAIGQLVAIHVYRHKEQPSTFSFIAMAGVAVLFGALLIAFTFVQPDFPMFQVHGPEG